jgi:hypothetical protein
MSVFAIMFDVVVTLAILWRQRRARPFIRPRVGLFLPLVLGFLGLVQLLDYTDKHHLTGAATAWLVVGLVAAAPALGAARAATVSIWRADPPFAWLVRRATGWTMALWAVTIAVPFVAAALVGGAGGSRDLAWSSYLVFLAISYAAQRVVEQARAQRQAAQHPVDGAAQAIDVDSEPLFVRPDGPNAAPGVIDVPSELLPPRPDGGR